MPIAMYSSGGGNEHDHGYARTATGLVIWLVGPTAGEVDWVWAVFLCWALAVVSALQAVNGR